LYFAISERAERVNVAPRLRYRDQQPNEKEPQMKTKLFIRNFAFTGAVTLLLASPVVAQGRYYQPVANGYANRIVEGTVALAEPARGGERIRLTNGMDLVVPNSVLATNQGRPYQMNLLHPGDVVRMTVYSREGDGRDARVRSFEFLRAGGPAYSNGYNNERTLTGTVLSVDRRNDIVVVQTERGRTVSVDVGSYNGRIRRGDRVSVSGRMDRDAGNFVASGVQVTRY
jgi:hypothetical protein